MSNQEQHDRITFDFTTGEIIFDTPGQKGTEIDYTLKDKRAAIMAAAGYDTVSGDELRKAINEMCQELGLNVTCAEPENK